MFGDSVESLKVLTSNKDETEKLSIWSLYSFQNTDKSTWLPASVPIMDLSNEDFRIIIETIVSSTPGEGYAA